MELMSLAVHEFFLMLSIWNMTWSYNKCDVDEAQ